MPRILITHPRCRLLAYQIMDGGYEVTLFNKYAWEVYRRPEPARTPGASTTVEITDWEHECILEHQKRLLTGQISPVDRQECESFIKHLRECAQTN